MRIALPFVLLLIAGSTYADCNARPASKFTVDFHLPACNAGAPCLSNTPIHFSVAPRAGYCYVPFYQAVCGPPYVIDSCDTLTWDFGDGTRQVVQGNGEVDHVFSKTGTFAVQVTIANGAGSGTLTGSAYICADPPSFVRFSQPVYNVSENGGSVTVTLERSGDLSRAFTLDYSTSSYDLSQPFYRNLETLMMKVSFASGETTKTITHRVQDDNVFTGNSDHSISVLSDGSAVMDTGAMTTATIHVIENEPPPPLPDLTIDDVTIPEGDGEHAIDFTVHLSTPATDPVYVFCYPHDGTAHAGTDYRAVQPNFGSIQPGQTSTTCPVMILGNTIKEPDKTFTVSTDVFGPARVKKGTALCTLVNDDTLAVPKQSLAFFPATLRMMSGTTEAVTLNASNSATVALVSSNPGIVQVDSSGSAPGPVRVIALKAGVATITATDGAAAAALEVSVQDDVPAVPAQSLSFVPATLRMTSGATVAVALGASIPTTVTMTSSDPDIVQIASSASAPGSLSVVGLKPGLAMITATDGMAAATLHVEVVPPPRRRAAR